MNKIYQARMKQKPKLSLFDYMRQRLKTNAPGAPAQKIMAPLIYQEGFDNFVAPLDAKESAVLALFYQPAEAKSLSIILTVRSEKLNSHKGQISFPGGALERGETITQAAVREAEEEIGLSGYSIELIGEMTPLYSPPTNSLVYPILAITSKIIDFKPNPDEVDEILITPVSQLERKKIQIKQVGEFDGKEIIAPCWDIHPKIPLWGLTAMFCSEIVELIENYYEGEFPLINIYDNNSIFL